MSFISHKGKLLRYRWMIVYLIFFLAVIITGSLLSAYLGDRARQEIFRENKATTLLLTTYLTDEFKRIQGSVNAMAGSPWIVPALISRKDIDIARANVILDRFNSALDASVSYLLDVQGITIASSNRNDPDSFVGESYFFRMYFTQAMKGSPSRYFALGVTSVKRGFYASCPVRDKGGEIVGVVVMKKDLDGIEHYLKNYPYCFIINQHGIIFLSSKPDMLMKSLWPVPEDIERDLLASRQFGDKPFEPVLSREIVDRMEVTMQGSGYIVSRKVIEPEGWSIVLMTSTDRIGIYKSAGAILTLVVCLLIMIPLTITYQTIKSAEAIRKSEERFQQVTQSSQDWIWEIDGEGKYIYSSQAVKHILGYAPEGVIGRYYYDFFVSEEREGLRHKFREFHNRKESFFRVVNRRVHRDGHHVFVESTAAPLLDAEGKMVGYRGTNRDISESEVLKEKLRESETIFRSIFDQSPIGAAISSVDFRFTHVNKAMCRMFGYSEEEFTSLTFKDITHPDYMATDMDQIRRLAAGELDQYITEKKYIRKDGNVIWGHLSLQPIRDAMGKIFCYLPLVVDITERKLAEEKIKEGERFLSNVFSSIQDGICVLDREFNIVRVNPTMEHWYSHGMPLVGKKCYEAFQGRENPCEICPSIKTIQTQTAAHDVVPKTGHDGSITGWIDLFSFPLLDEQTGESKGVIEYIRDITEYKKAEEEREKLERSLLLARKMEAIGTLAGGIAHDFNNLMMGIQGYTSLMLLATDLNHPNYHKLKSIEEQVRSGAELTAQLLGFARGGRYEIKPTDLNSVIKGTSTMFGRTKKEITIHQKYCDDLWPAEVERGQIEQVLLNLYVNAWQAMQKGGELYLETDNVILDENYAQRYSVAPGRYVKISVTDTGVGMDEETRERIFEPFFTTKEMGRGTGLGLATVYGIIKGHNGIINVYSEKGQGTTFNIYFPASEKEIKPDRKVSEEQLLKGSETVLLVDDEDVVISVTKEILESLGYKVLIAKSGPEAIDIYRANKDEIDLVLLDMIMPEMGGGETFDILKEINPDIKVILSSGYTLNGTAIKIMAKGCYAFIQKPFTIMALSQKIKEVFGESSS